MPTLTLRPTANGTTIQNAAYGDSPSYKCVDEASSDGDATFVHTNNITGAKKDTYAMQDHAAETGAISSVTVYAVCKEVGGDGTAALVVRTNGTDYVDSNQATTTSYATYSKAWALNPNTGAAWTWDEIDAMECGISLIGSASVGVRCTQVWAVVEYTTETGGSDALLLLLGVG